jgi:hypothetical protein
VTATPINGTGTITYQWVKTTTGSGAGYAPVTCSNTAIANPTFSVVAGGNSGDSWTVTVTANSRSYQATVAFLITVI